MQAKEEVIFVIIVVVFLLIFLAIMFLVFLARSNTRKNKLLFENERMQREFEQTLLNTRLEIQEQTFDYISREIHDNIGQTLSLARMQMNSDDPLIQVGTDELLGRAIADLRTLSHSLNTNHIKDIGFVKAVQVLVDRFDKLKRFNIRLIKLSDDIVVNEEKGLIVFRVIQEVLNNIIKHARASNVDVILKRKGQVSEITVSDDGAGFDAGNLSNGGIGLRNMTDRVSLIGGNLTINSKIGKGTQIKIVLPNG